MNFEIGTTAGGYEFLDIVSSSKDGVTYRVRNVLAQRLELLKVLPKNFQDDQDRVARFLREMKVHARLVHPNIVTFYTAAEIERQLVTTTELVEGPTLAERLELGPLPWQEAAEYASQVLAALECAHGHGVVHRDINPNNLILTAEGTVKLTGFGFARASTDPQLTQVGTAIGSVHYMSPEQVRGTGAPDARSDIYSLGAVLYEAVTGQTPFSSKSQFEIMVAHVNELPKAPRALNPGIPEELEDMIMKALAKDPSQRFQNAREFQEALAEVRGVAEARREVLPAPGPVGGAQTGLADPDSAMPAAAFTPGRDGSSTWGILEADTPVSELIGPVLLASTIGVAVVVLMFLFLK